MSKPGPKRKDLRLLKAAGSPLARGRSTIATPPFTTLRAPAWLSDDAKPHWQRLVKQLTPLGILASVDANALGRYCTMGFQALSGENFR